MLRRPRFITIVQIERVMQSLFLLLILSLLMLADGYVLILASRVVGIYLLLAAEATTGLVAVVAILLSYRDTLERIRVAIGEDRYPEPEFRHVVCLWVSAILLVVPGFVTDALGLAVLVPPLRWAAGRWLVHAGRRGFDELCEYLRLEE